ncbi:hypothetical protein [Nodularia sp. LEGE 06071]
MDTLTLIWLNYVRNLYRFLIAIDLESQILRLFLAWENRKNTG